MTGIISRTAEEGSGEPGTLASKKLGGTPYLTGASTAVLAMVALSLPFPLARVAVLARDVPGLVRMHQWFFFEFPAVSPVFVVHMTLASSAMVVLLTAPVVYLLGCRARSDARQPFGGSAPSAPSGCAIRSTPWPA